MISETDHQVRHVYLNVAHSTNPQRPGTENQSGVTRQRAGRRHRRAEPKTFIDNFRTPHGPKLHVVERFRIIDGGKT